MTLEATKPLGHKGPLGEDPGTPRAYATHYQRTTGGPGPPLRRTCAVASGLSFSLTRLDQHAVAQRWLSRVSQEEEEEEHQQEEFTQNRTREELFVTSDNWGRKHNSCDPSSNTCFFFVVRCWVLITNSLDRRRAGQGEGGVYSHLRRTRPWKESTRIELSNEEEIH